MAIPKASPLSLLTDAIKRVHRFQRPYQRFILWSARARGTISLKLETLYRDCQKFATDEIEGLSSGIGFDFSDLGVSDPGERPAGLPQHDAADSGI